MKIVLNDGKYVWPVASEGDYNDSFHQIIHPLRACIIQAFFGERDGSHCIVYLIDLI